jgi:predicted O-methyltransferase YrrM
MMVSGLSLGAEGRVLSREDANVRNQVPDRAHGMLGTELSVLEELVSSSGATRLLEIGMANGSSTVTLLRAAPAAHLTSIDPFQRAPTATGGYDGEGIKRLAELELLDRHTLIEEKDYEALPELYRARQQFDFVLIDGYHGFDYVLLDFFYADLLVTDGGMVVFHDSCWPAVLKVCQFVEANKPYRRVGPPLLRIYPEERLRRIARRAWHLATGQSSKYRDRRERWKSVAAFVKERTSLSEEFALRGC